MKKLFFTILILFSFYDTTAQVKQPVNNTLQQENIKKNKKKVDVVQASVDLLKEKLNLDRFQEAIARNLVTSNQAKSKEIIESRRYSDEEKRDILVKYADEFNLELKKNLSKEQIEKYEKMIAKK